MTLAEAKEFIGKTCSIIYTDRDGSEFETTAKIYDVSYVPLYGGYLMTAEDDIRFDRIRSVSFASAGAETSATPTYLPEKVAA